MSVLFVGGLCCVCWSVPVCARFNQNKKHPLKKKKLQVFFSQEVGDELMERYRQHHASKRNKNSSSSSSDSGSHSKKWFWTPKKTAATGYSSSSSSGGANINTKPEARDDEKTAEVVDDDHDDDDDAVVVPWSLLLDITNLLFKHPSPDVDALKRTVLGKVWMFDVVIHSAARHVYLIEPSPSSPSSSSSSPSSGVLLLVGGFFFSFFLFVLVGWGHGPL